MTMTVTRHDIEAKLREIKGEVDETTDQAKPVALAVGVAVAVAVVGLAFVWGKRRGRKRATIVEVRRV
jgi:hypothetical protein